MSEAPAVPDIVQEHLEELGFLTLMRRRLLFAPDVSLTELGPHDGRIEAHWDGLEIAGAVGVELAVEGLAAFDPWDVFAAARVWLAIGAPTPEEVVERIAETDEEKLGAWREAFRWTPSERVFELFPTVPDPADDAVRALFVDALGWHGPLWGHTISGFAFSEEAGLRRSLARAIGWGGASHPDAPRLLETLLEDPEEGVRRAALWSKALTEPAPAVSLVRERARSGNGDAFDARVLGLLGVGTDRGVLLEGIDAGERGLACVRALGDLGSPEDVDRLIELAGEEDEGVAVAAADAIETILGDIDLPDDQAPRETEDGRELPGPENLRSFWEARRSSFSGADRLLRGHAFPWAGELEEEPMEALWRRAVRADGAAPDWLRKEVPDGFFSGAPLSEARAGE